MTWLDLESSVWPLKLQIHHVRFPYGSYKTSAHLLKPFQRGGCHDAQSCSSTVGKKKNHGGRMSCSPSVTLFIFSYIYDLVYSLGRDGRSNLANGTTQKWHGVGDGCLYGGEMKGCPPPPQHTTGPASEFKVPERERERAYRRKCVCCTGPPPCAGRCRCPLRWRGWGCCRSVCVGSDRRRSPPSTETRATSTTTHLSLQHTQNIRSVPKSQFYNVIKSPNF